MSSSDNEIDNEPVVFPRRQRPTLLNESMSLSDNEIDNEPVVIKRRKRAKMNYKKHSEASKLRVITAYDEGNDWAAIATANDIPIKTALRIIKSGTPKNKKRGGSVGKKITEDKKLWLIEKIEENRTIGLKELSAMLHRDFQLQVTPQCIAYNLRGLCYSFKKISIEPSAMNTPANKEKRQLFSQQLQAAKQEERMIVYVDETNFNIHISKSKAWAKKGERATVKLHSTKAP